MSITTRMLAPAVTGEPRCHFLVQWRDSHAIQHGRTFTTWQGAAEFDAAIKAGKLPRDAPGRRAAVTFGTAVADCGFGPVETSARTRAPPCTVPPAAGDWFTTLFAGWLEWT